MSGYIDITRPVNESLTAWPGRAPPRHRWVQRIASGDHCNASFWELSAHSGTHMDAPLHFIDKGLGIDEIDPGVFFGPCRVIELGSGPLGEGSARELLGVERLLIKTAHSLLPVSGVYQAHDRLMTEPAATRLVEHGLRLIGTDRLSVDDSKGQGYPLHRLFLGAGCVIVEGLLLAEVGPGPYELFAAPLRLAGTEASPVRAILKRRTR